MRKDQRETEFAGSWEMLFQVHYFFLETYFIGQRMNCP